MSSFTPPPSKLLLQIANDGNHENFQRSFENVRASALNYCREANLEFSQFSRVLDFGCGLGRFLFAFEDFLAPGQKLFGCDLNKDCADWCQENIGFAEIINSPQSPPLPYADGSFDYINAVSVFTHLTLENQFHWAWEIHRILKPGGIVVATTNGLPHLPFLLSLKGNVFQHSDYYGIGDNGFFCSLTESKSVDIEGQREVVTLYSDDALVSCFRPLELIYNKPLSTLAGGQRLSIFRKSANPKIVLPQVDGDNLRFASQSLGSKLRCYISFDADAYFSASESIVYSVAAEGGGEIIRGNPIEINRIFKSTHLIEFEIDVPPQDTAFKIQIGRPPDSRLPKIRINFPHLLSYGGGG